MTKQNKVFLNAPEGVKVRRHNIGGDNQEIRFTIPDDGFQRLVAVSKHNRFVWLHKDFQKG